jgi:hypothetical protein
MRYFTKEIWAGAQEYSPSIDYSRDWQNRVSRYFRQLDRLEARLSGPTFRFFRNVSLHDGRVVALTVLDEVGLNLKRGTKWDKRRQSVNVKIEAVAATGPSEKVPRYVLGYSGVRHLVVDYPSEYILFPNGGLGSWGHDELTSAGRNHLRHEILFSSGATVSIECARVTVGKG